MEEMSRFRNEVRQAKQKHKKRKGSTKINLHKSKKRHKPDKRLSFPKRPRYERYMPLTTNFNLEVPIRLPLMKPPRLGLGATKYCRDFKGINPINQDDLVVVSTSIENFMVSRVLINQGNSTDILYWKDFHRLKVSLDNVHLHVSPLLSFYRQKSRDQRLRGLDDYLRSRQAL
ncbi:hypothetical protein JHK87_055649 [Glycine soja]|nr:hypothetical protein JHK87_055649 [Glycine soja]